MGRPGQPELVRLFVGVLVSKISWLAEVRQRLIELYGTIQLESELINFDFTHFYDAEMGQAIKRIFLAFEHLIDPGELATIKLATNDLEVEFSGMQTDVSRPVNLDPGYLTASKIVLATTKNNAHRIYLHSGIYAELTLLYQAKQGWQAQRWTYPDYRSTTYHDFFDHLRTLHLDSMK